MHHLQLRRTIEPFWQRRYTQGPEANTFLVAGTEAPLVSVSLSWVSLSALRAIAAGPHPGDSRPAAQLRPSGVRVRLKARVTLTSSCYSGMLSLHLLTASHPAHRL